MRVDAAEVAAPSVTPWRSKNSRIWIATLRPLSSRSRSCAAMNSPFGSASASVDHDRHDLGRRAAQEEVVVRDLVHLSHAPEQLQQPPHLGLRKREKAGDVAHARRAEAVGAAEQRLDAVPELLVARREPHLVAGEPHPGAVERKLARRAPAPAAWSERRQPAAAARAAAAAVPGRCPGRSGFSAWNASSVATRLRLSRVQHAAESASEAPGMAIGTRPSRPAIASISAAASARSRAKADEVDIVGRRVEQRRQRLLRVGDGVGGKLRQALRRAALARGRAQIEEAPAADGALGGRVAQHEAVAGRRPRSAFPAPAARTPRCPAPPARRRAARRGRRHPRRHGGAAPASIGASGFRSEASRRSDASMRASAHAGPDRARRRRA